MTDMPLRELSIPRVLLFILVPISFGLWMESWWAGVWFFSTMMFVLEVRQ